MKRLMQNYCVSILLLVLITGCGKQPVEVTVVTGTTPKEGRTDNPNIVEIIEGEDEKTSLKAASSIETITFVDTPESTCFSQIGYDYDHGLLYVTFRSSGASYVYSEVPNEVWKSLLNAESKGSYYNKEIKGQFPCKKQ